MLPFAWLTLQMLKLNHMTKEIITEKLIAAGADPTRIEWREDYLRYGYWSLLPEAAYDAIAEYMYEDLYEDDDGDDDRGRPIIRRLYSYHFKPTKTT